MDEKERSLEFQNGQTIRIEDILLEQLRVMCERHGIATASATASELIVRIERQLTILKRDLQRAKTFGKDPSGRWG